MTAPSAWRSSATAWRAPSSTPRWWPRREGMEVAAVVTRNPARARAVAEDLPGAVVLDSADRIWESPRRLRPGRGGGAQPRARPPCRGRRCGPAWRWWSTSRWPQPPRRLGGWRRSAEETGVLLTVFHNRRWDNDFLTVRRLLEEGTLGPLVRFESRFERYRPEVDGERWRESAVARGGWRPAARPRQPPDRPGPGRCSATPRTCTPRWSAGVRARRSTTTRSWRCASARGPIAHLWAGALAYRPGPAPARERVREASTSALGSIRRRRRFAPACGPATPAGARSPRPRGAGSAPTSTVARSTSASAPSAVRTSSFYALPARRDPRRRRSTGGSRRTGWPFMEVIEAARTSARERRVVALGD